MSDDEEKVEKSFAVEIAKQGRAACKKCQQKCLQGKLRIGKLVPNLFDPGTMQKNWYHVDCMFEVFAKQRQATKRIEYPEDIGGWELLNDDDQSLILTKIKASNKAFEAKFGVKITPEKQKSPKANVSEKKESSNVKDVIKGGIHRDFLFKEFRRLIADISNESGYIEKTKIIEKMFKKGSDDTGFKGDIILWCRLLLPGVVKRIYNLQSKQLIKLFSKIFGTDQETMLEHLEQGDIGQTIQHFFLLSKKFHPAKNSYLTVEDVDEFLEELSKLTKEDEQIYHFKSFAKNCTANDLKILVRLIKHDLRMNAGAKHVLDAVHPDAYEAYQSSRDIESVIKRCLENKKKDTKVGSVKATIKVMTPILPMLADSCKSVEQAMKKCPNGMYSEIKYDGERVQVHKCGSEFKYFSRSLKPVLHHKVAHFKDYIPKAFPFAKDLILDSEILMIDTVTGKPLPFGTLGKHKKNEFKDATVCLFVFDCVYYNGESLTSKPMKYRRKILEENMREIPNHIVFSEMQEIHKPEELSSMIAKVLKLGLEGLVLKDLLSIYEPGKRHWLKVKKDYLFDGAMADTADLIVLGAWYGTGKKGGMMSVFLMGCYNTFTHKFCTVTKVHTGHDDKTLEKLQNELDMIKISCDASKVPKWLNCTKTMIPDFVARDPKHQPVWEITGAEFTKHDVHTADGISIRFPRVTRIRDDKDWKTATTVQELETLYKNSKENTDVSLLLKGINSSEDSNSSEGVATSSKKQKNLLSYVKKEIKHENSSDHNEKLQSPTKKKTLLDYIEQDIISEDKKKPKESPKRKRSSSGTLSKLKKLKTQDNYKETVVLQNPIPDYFQGISAILTSEVKDKCNDSLSEILRYFVTYGGVVLESDKGDSATHVFHVYGIVEKPVIKCSKFAKHVVVDWIRDSVSNESLQDYRPYTVRWDPSI